MRSSGAFFGSACSACACCDERTRPPFLARAQAAVPEIDERRVPRLQRREAEAIAVVLDVRAIELLDERVDAAARLPRRLRQPAGEEHVVLGFEPLQLGSRAAADRVRSRWVGHGVYRGMRNQTSGSQSSRAYGTGRSSISTSVASRAADDLEQIAQPRRRRSTRTARGSGAPAPLPVSRNSADARASSSARGEVGDVERRKHERDRKRPRPARRTAPRADRDRAPRAPRRSAARAARRTARTARAAGILAVPRSQLYCRMAPCLEHADRVRAFAGRFVQA